MVLLIEHCGALFCNLLPGPITEDFPPEVITQTIMQTISVLMNLIKEYEEKNNLPHQPSSLNFAVTNGKTTVVTRYRDHPNESPPSLYYTLVKDYEIEGTNFKIEKTEVFQDSMGLIICSEPLTFDKSEWTKVPKNSIITVTDTEYIIGDIPMFSTEIGV